MKIEIIGTESLGVRGLCCFVSAADRRFLIDPGIALGYRRHGLLPHPIQVEEGAKIRPRIIERWGEATDIVISHFHGDHVPLADANPFQLGMQKLEGLNPQARIWTKAESHLSPRERKRREDFERFLENEIICGEEKSLKWTARDGSRGSICFSGAVPHGEPDPGRDTVMMTCIRDRVQSFVHASDIQLLNDEAVEQILDWKADIVLVGGPPLYLGRHSAWQIGEARRRAVALSSRVPILILDHHVLRDREGIGWLEWLAGDSENKVICGADFMQRPRRFLEADREALYASHPIPQDR